MRSLPLFICTLQISCATLTSTHQNVQVDSNPRGQSFQAETEEQSDFHTPKSLALQRRRTLRFRLVAENRDQEFSCDFRWTPVLLGNLLFAGLGYWGIGAGVAVVTDLVTGAAWNCPERVQLAGAGKPMPSYRLGCDKYFPVNGQFLAESSRQDWFQRVREESEVCVDFVDPEIASNELQSRGLGEILSEPKQFLSSESALAIAVQYEVSHFAFFSPPEGSTLTTRSRIFDAVSQTQTGSLALNGGKRPETASTPLGGMLLAALPNSISLGTDLLWVPAFEEVGGGQRSQRHPSVFDRINRLQVARVQPYEKLESLAFKFDAGLTFSLEYSKASMKGKHKDGKEVRSDVGKEHFFGGVSGNAYMGTPLGTLQTFLSPGAGWWNVSNDADRDAKWSFDLRTGGCSLNLITSSILFSTCLEMIALGSGPRLPSLGEHILDASAMLMLGYLF